MLVGFRLLNCIYLNNMKIGLLDIDSHNFPNLALMKLSAYHKQQGDTVEWVNHFYMYDRVYKSKTFTFTPDDSHVLKCQEVVKGGTGYRLYGNIFCDETEPATWKCKATRKRPASHVIMESSNSKR